MNGVAYSNALKLQGAGRPRESLRIAGAGPAGLAAALCSARAGVKTVVYEAASTVGRRFHGDFQGLENWTTRTDVLEELATLGIEASFDYDAVREVVAFDPSGRDFNIRSPEPLFYLVRRGAEAGTLDRSLRDQALAAGVEIRFGKRLTHLGGGGVVAGGPRGADVIAAGYVFETDSADSAYAAVGKDLASSGYAYLLVSGNRGTLAVCLFDRFHEQKTFLERSVSFFKGKTGITLENAKFFGGAGTFPRGRSASRTRVLEAGEAAGFQDALWGFGIRYAILSGHLAARSYLLETDYDHLWERRLGAMMRTSIVNRFLVERLGDPGYSRIVRKVSGRSEPRRWLRRLYASSRWKSLLNPLARRALFSAARTEPCPREGCDCVWCRCWRHADEQKADHHSPAETEGG